MPYHYIIPLHNENDLRDHAEEIGLLPRSAGPRWDTNFPEITLFTSKDTPALSLPDGGVLIGQLFDHTGTQVVDITTLSRADDAAHIRKQLLHDYWGDYIAIQPAPYRNHFTVMNSPSCSSTLPCIYSFQNGRGFISSHVSLAAKLGLYGRRTDWEYLAQFLAFPFLRTERTALADVGELLPGMLARFNRSGVSTEPVWSPWTFVAPERRHTEFHEATTSVRNATLLAVQSFAAADKAVLLELSGGLDSSIVGVCLRDSAAKVACSTLTTPIPGADERLYAKLIAETLGTELRAEHLPIESARFSFEDATDPVRPSVGPLQIAIDEVMEAASDTLMVNGIFSGGGGDAVFGYLRTAAPAVDALMERGIRAGLRSVQDLASLHQCSVWRGLQLTIRKKLREPASPYQQDRLFLAPTVPTEVSLDHPWYHAPEGALPGDRERIFALAGNQIFMDYVPRRASRPFRMPLLSQPVIEACLRTPSWMWISGGQNRAVARAAFSDALPENVLSRRSKGTLMNYLGEVYQQNKIAMLDFLMSGNLRSHGMLDSVALQNFISAKLPPRDRKFIRVLDLCRVENWTRQQA